MPVGQGNAPMTVQRTLQASQTSANWERTLFYPGDVISFPKTNAKHIDYVRSVLTLLVDARVIEKL